MKTYTKEVEMPRLVIKYDDTPESPREWDNLGYFITCEDRYNSPDEHPILQRIVKYTGDEAENAEEHMKLIKDEVKELMDEDVVYIVPVYRYEHGNVVYRAGRGTGWDASNCGFYIVTKQTQDVIGTSEVDFHRVIKGELEDYTQYANGQVYGFTLFGEDGEVEDSCYGFYDIEHIREHLGEEWAKEKLEDYLVI